MDPKIILSRFAQTGNIPHALLFTGRDDSVKAEIALGFIKSLIPDRAMPFDFLHISDSPIPIEKVREIKQNFIEGPLAGPYKVALIANAQDMRLDAANTFLKLLEEPARRALFILMAQTRSSVLPTIASRALEVRFPAMRDLHQNTQDYEGIIEILDKGSFAEKFRVAQKYSLKNKPELLNVLDAWLIKLRHKLILGETANIIFFKKIFQLKKVIFSTNANPQLLLEELFIGTL